MFAFLISEVLCNIYQDKSPQRGKLLLRSYRNVWIMRGLFGKHFQSTGPGKYQLCVHSKIHFEDESSHFFA